MSTTTLRSATAATHPPESATDGRTQVERRLSPSSLAGRGPRVMLLRQTRSELLASLRVPEFIIGVVAIPVMLFAMFGVPNARWELGDGLRVSSMMLGGFGAFGLLSLAIFAFGVDIAAERGKGWLRLLRTTPAPAWVYFAGKLVTSVLIASVTLLALFTVAATLAQVTFPLRTWAALFAVLLLGGLCLAPLGFSLGFLARPRAASTIGNLVFLPLSFASGFFVPLNQLPELLRDLAPYLPTFHYAQLVWRTIASPEIVASYTGVATGPLWVHAAWLVATFITFAFVASLAYRRERSREAI